MQGSKTTVNIGLLCSRCYSKANQKCTECNRGFCSYCGWCEIESVRRHLDENGQNIIQYFGDDARVRHHTSKGVEYHGYYLYGNDSKKWPNFMCLQCYNEQLNDLKVFGISQ